ncbi:site-specific integrase [Clostridium thermarum]|uniref:site-specific integrase n=1 Tax=Clostridium thermarum TaxID=1716543 RepID=UPI0013D09C99|nr:tyrosine-type recombinase/integrase [Clostridium thermarum]
MHIQKMYSTLMRSDISNSTILKVHRMFRMALTHGVGWQMLHNNPTDAVKPPKAEYVELKVWDAETANAFLDKIKDEPIYMTVLIALQTGMREGEICALRWEQVDLDKKNLFVKYTLQKNEEKVLAVKAPKTKNLKEIFF